MLTPTVYRPGQSVEYDPNLREFGVQAGKLFKQDTFQQIQQMYMVLSQSYVEIKSIKMKSLCLIKACLKKCNLKLLPKHNFAFLNRKFR